MSHRQVARDACAYDGETLVLVAGIKNVTFVHSDVMQHKRREQNLLIDWPRTVI